MGVTQLKFLRSILFYLIVRCKLKFNSNTCYVINDLLIYTKRLFWTYAYLTVQTIHIHTCMHTHTHTHTHMYWGHGWGCIGLIQQ